MNDSDKKVLGSIISVAGVIALVHFLSCASHKEFNSREKDLKSALSLAAGEDGILSREEEIKLYRDLGFNSEIDRKKEYTLGLERYNNISNLHLAVKVDTPHGYKGFRILEIRPAKNLESYIEKKKNEVKM